MSNSHSQGTVEVEADSLEEARRQVKSQIPPGLSILSERIISDGKPKTAKGVSETTAEARARAQTRIPNGADVVAEKMLSTPERKVLTVEAFDEESARVQAENQSGSTALIKAVKLLASGSKGFLGIRRKPNLYEVEVSHQAIIEITYKMKARISAEIGDLKQYRRARAIEWWKGKGPSSKKCDICSRVISSNEGYLLDTNEIVRSHKYIDHATSLRARSTVTGMNVPGMDSVVMDAVMPAMKFVSQVQVMAALKKVTTPWLACEDCLGKYFAET